MTTIFYPTNLRQQANIQVDMGATGPQVATGPQGDIGAPRTTSENVLYMSSSWKGNGIFSNPIGITATHIRPLTNSDPGNIFPTKFGLPRPIKHYRKGTTIPFNFTADMSSSIDIANSVRTLEHNINRAVKSSVGTSLGGGNGGTGLISQLIDMPGSFIVKDNNPDTSNPLTIDTACNTCKGVGIVSGWFPNNYLTNNPTTIVTTPPLCCNQQRKAKQRVLPTNTNIKKNYYQNSQAYLYNRCKTFKQTQFNFVNGVNDTTLVEIIKTHPFVSAKNIEYIKPGDPLSYNNLYVSQCNPNSTIEIGAQLAFINSLSKTLLSFNYISQEQYTKIINQPNTTIPLFIDYLKHIVTLEVFKEVIDYLNKIITNPLHPMMQIGQRNLKGCSQVYYKPNNPQYATQGSVSSSSRILKLTVDTISMAVARNRKITNSMTNANISVPFIYKDKTQSACRNQTVNGNKRYCV